MTIVGDGIFSIVNCVFPVTVFQLSESVNASTYATYSPPIKLSKVYVKTFPKFSLKIFSSPR